MGPHPAVAEVRRAVRAALPAEGYVLVACSGGADSLALAAAAAFECRERSAALITVDHGLQPGSADQAAAVAAVGYELGFDPAETVLLGLGRGSGPRSIAGMRPADGRYRRPFLGVRRATTQAACDTLGLTPWHDPHNADPAYQRVRLRRDVLPLLEDVLQGGVAEALARTAALTQADLDALDALAAGISRDSETLDVAALKDQPQAIRTRVLRAWALAGGAAPLTATHIAALDALVAGWHGQGPVDLPGGFAVRRASGRLHLQRTPRAPGAQPRTSTEE